MNNLMQYDDLRVTELSKYEESLIEQIRAPGGADRFIRDTSRLMDTAPLSVPSHGEVETWPADQEIYVDNDEFDCPQLIVPIGALKVTLPKYVVDSSFIISFHVKVLRGADVFNIPSRHVYNEDSEKSQSDVDYYLDVSTTLVESLTGNSDEPFSYGGFNYADEVTDVFIFLYHPELVR